MVRLLRPEDAPALQNLAQSLYPQDFWMELEELRRTLEPDDNLCLGYFQDGQLQGYLMCWPDFSQVEGREDEPILLVDDVVVSPRHSRGLYLLLAQLSQLIYQRGHSLLALEGNSRSGAHQLWQSHPRVLARLGFQCVATYAIQEAGQETLYWCRYEPDSSELSANPLSE